MMLHVFNFKMQIFLQYNTFTKLLTLFSFFFIKALSCAKSNWKISSWSISYISIHVWKFKNLISLPPFPLPPLSPPPSLTPSLFFSIRWEFHIKITIGFWSRIYQHSTLSYYSFVLYMCHLYHRHWNILLTI